MNTNEDAKALRDLNEKINDAENTGDAARLSTILAPKLVFQRADPLKTIDDRDAFLQKVKAGGDRTIRMIEPIELYGDRAVVQCMVKTGGKEYHNLRLFVRREGCWKLLAWANEPV